MSLILDALKKAEAERKAGTTQTVHMPAPFSTYQQRQPVWRKPWPWAIVATSAAMLGIVVWLNSPKAPAPAPAPVAAVATHQDVPMQSPPAAMKQPVPESTLPKPSAPMAETPLAEPPPVKVKEKVAKKTVEKKRAPTPPATKTVQAAAPSEPAVPTLRELPEQIQREIPTLAISGYIYSGNKADRSVLINKRLLREGDEVAPGLTLEKMMPNGMVMNYKGYRYRAGY